MSVDQDNKDPRKNLLAVARAAVQADDALREKYGIGEKFRFIRTQLHDLLDQIEKHTQVIEAEEQKAAGGEMVSDETKVYVYLYNANGAVFTSWLNMLTPKLFYEYSVNRPIYAEQSQVESLIRAKTNKMQHAYLTVIMKQADIVVVEPEAIKKDVSGNPMIKVREGSLSFDRFVAFMHNGVEYVLNTEGKLVKKEA